ncbi:MAG TPA: SPFH domain-containing protein [Candidatus Baltobacteraceae bacterium]|nr:SPFH domain-containing protein [Candidatus Baltobacteraceae bacterium]
MASTVGVSVFVVVAIVVVAALAAIALFRAMWRVAEPNEALIISGLHHRPPESAGESLGFKIVTGRGTLVIPGVQVVRRLSLDLRESELQIQCVTQQGIPVHIKGVVIYKVGDDFASIANAARRFLDQQDRMDARIQQVFAGHLRAICGSLTVEDLIRERDKLTEATRSASGTEMEKLGLIVDSLQIQEIDDPTGYIDNLAKPHAAAVLRDARIAQAQADREATEREQEANALKALAERDSKIKQAGYQAEVDKAAAQAKQAGPLADATARQQVVVEETKIVELDAHKKEQELLVTVRRPADAAAYEKTTIATAQRDADIAAAEARAKQIELQAQADATRVKLAADAESQKTKMLGEAEGAAIRARGAAEGDAINARGLAEAAAIKARAEALAQNQEAVIGQQLAEKWPAIVDASSKAFAGIDQMIVMNGADGVSEIMGKVLTQGVAGLQLARNLLARTRSGSAANAEPPAATLNGEAARRSETV